MKKDRLAGQTGTWDNIILSLVKDFTSTTIRSVREIATSPTRNYDYFRSKIAKKLRFNFFVPSSGFYFTNVYF